MKKGLLLGLFGDLGGWKHEREVMAMGWVSELRGGLQSILNFAEELGPHPEILNDFEK